MLLPQPPQPPSIQPVVTPRVYGASTIVWSDRLATFFWTLSLALLPWVAISSFGDGVELPQQTAAFLLGFACLATEAWRWWQTPRHRSPIVWLALLLIPGVTLLSALWSVDRYGSLVGSGGQIAASALTMGIGLLFAVAAVLRANDDWFAVAAPWWVWSMGGFLLFQFIHPTGNSAAKAVSGLIAVVAALGWLWHESDKGWFARRDIRGWIAWLGLLFAWGMTTAYLWLLDDIGLWIIVLIAVVLLSGFGWRAWTERPRSPALWLASLWKVIAIAGLLFVLPQPLVLAKSARLSAPVTLTIAETALREHPILGVGSAGWTALFDRLRPAGFNVGVLTQTTFDYGYSTMTTLLASVGLLGIMAWLISFVLIGWFAIRAWLSDQENTSLVWIAAWGTLLAVGFVFTWQVTQTIWFWLITGSLLTMSSDYEDIRLSVWRRRLFLGGIGVLVVIFILLTIGLGARVLAESAASNANISSALSSTEAARRLNPWQKSYLDQEVMLRVQGIQTNTGSEQIRTLIDRARLETERWPFAAASWAALAIAYQSVSDKIEGADVFAIRAWQEAIARRPTDPLYPRRLAGIFVQQAQETSIMRSSKDEKVKQGAEKTMREQYRLAQQWLERAQQLQPTNPEIAYELAVVLAKEGELDQALKMMSEVYKAVPNEPSVALEYAVLLQLAKRPTEAISILEKALTQDASIVRVRVFLADVYEDQKRFTEALRTLNGLSASQQQDAAIQARLKRLRAATANVRMIPSSTNP